MKFQTQIDTAVMQVLAQLSNNAQSKDKKQENRSNGDFYECGDNQKKSQLINRLDEIITASSIDHSCLEDKIMQQNEKIKEMMSKFQNDYFSM